MIFQDLIIIGAQLIEVVSYHESFKIAKVCQVWEQVVLLPNIVLPASVSESLVNWILLVLKYENHGNAMIFHDVLNCLSSAVRLKEVKQTKVSSPFPYHVTFIKAIYDVFFFIIKIL